MARPRVHEVAKELGLTSKEVLAHLESIGAPAKSHSSAIDESVADRVRADLANGAGPQTQAAAPDTSGAAPDASAPGAGETGPSAGDLATAEPAPSPTAARDVSIESPPRV
jgi:translation initiation factor IF-2